MKQKEFESMLRDVINEELLEYYNDQHEDGFDGYSNEFQRVYVHSQCTSPRHSDMDKIKKLAKEGKYVVYTIDTVHCKSTDASLGECESYVAEFPTYEQALKKAEEVSKGADGVGILGPHNVDKQPTSIEPTDSGKDMPFEEGVKKTNEILGFRNPKGVKNDAVKLVAKFNTGKITPEKYVKELETLMWRAKTNDPEYYPALFAAVKKWKDRGIKESGFDTTKMLGKLKDRRPDLYPLKENKIKDPTREEMLKYLQTIYSGLLDKSSFDDYVEPAMYWFANFNHGGQTSNLYSVLSTSTFRPGPISKGPEKDSVEEDMYNDLVREFGDGQTVNEIKQQNPFKVGDKVILRKDVLVRHARSVPAHMGYNKNQFSWRKTLDGKEGVVGTISRIFPNSKHVNVKFDKPFKSKDEYDREYETDTIGIDYTELEPTTEKPLTEGEWSSTVSAYEDGFKNGKLDKSMGQENPLGLKAGPSPNQKAYSQGYYDGYTGSKKSSYDSMKFREGYGYVHDKDMKKDPKHIKGKRWTVKYENNIPLNEVKSVIKEILNEMLIVERKANEVKSQPTPQSHDEMMKLIMSLGEGQYINFRENITIYTDWIGVQMGIDGSGDMIWSYGGRDEEPKTIESEDELYEIVKETIKPSYYKFYDIGTDAEYVKSNSQDYRDETGQDDVDYPSDRTEPQYESKINENWQSHELPKDPQKIVDLIESLKEGHYIWFSHDKYGRSGNGLGIEKTVENDEYVFKTTGKYGESLETEEDILNIAKEVADDKQLNYYAVDTISGYKKSTPQYDDDQSVGEYEKNGPDQPSWRELYESKGKTEKTKLLKIIREVLSDITNNKK